MTFAHRPLNIFGPKTIPQLSEIIAALETDEHVKVVVIESAVDGFFLTHYDFLDMVRRGGFRLSTSRRVRNLLLQDHVEMARDPGIPDSRCGQNVPARLR